MNTKKKALALAEGLKLLANDATEVLCTDGAVLVGLGDDGSVAVRTADSLRALGWFVDAFTGRWCFCV